MLDFIKKLFRKEEEIVERIARDGLINWFDEKVKGLEQEVRSKRESLNREISEKINEAKESLDILDKAELRNPNISVREKQFMEGNRKAYLQKTAHFLKEIEGILEHEITFLLQTYDEYLENFGKSTARAYAILQEFFAHEARDIALKIKQIDTLIAAIKNDEKIHGHIKAGKIRRDMASIENKIIKKKELTEQIGSMKKEFSRLNGEEKNLAGKKEGLFSSDEHKGFLNLIESRKKTEEGIKQLKDRLYSDFSLLERPLRKYQRIAFQYGSLVEYYSVDALKALVSDTGFKIVEILNGMAKNITDSKLILKDRKTDKVLDAVAKLDEKYFTDFMHNYNLIIGKKEELDRLIEENPVKKEIDEINDRLEGLGDEINSLKTRKNMAQNELDSIDIDKLKEKLKADMENVFKVKIEWE